MTAKSIISKLRYVLALVVVACMVLGCGQQEEKVQANQNDTVVDSSIQGIVGTWFEDGVLDPRTLTIKADGTYELAYKGGGKAYGTIRVTAEPHPDGTSSLWYIFDENDGKNWAGFAKNDDGSLQNDLWSGQDGKMHFIRSQDNKKHGNTEGISPNDYLGVWACGRATAVIEKKDNKYIATITWAKSAMESREWYYSCRYDKEKAILVCPGNGICTDCIVYDNGKENDINVYSDGSCELIMREGVLRWKDKKENAGKGLEFLR
ncbi:MAG: hypothetical protein E7197_01880 [Anaerovibrio sp.]|uniref:hypothetical protein n=1 Tax=Anaerovibrio sp. TaxID=1872532 RepID=UPI0025B89A6A|nr:hypothetical protein [Anaerovibrio sp.]MBE6098783.1 hypothetical protein [Anaerovibrio sp.]